MNVVLGDVALQHLCTDYTLRFQYFLVCFWNDPEIFLQAVVFPCGLYLVLLAIPIFGTAIDTCTYDRLFPVNGYAAENGGRTVSLYLAAVDIG